MTGPGVNRVNGGTMEAYLTTLYRSIWADMMAGKVSGWVTFFRMIETGGARRILDENLPWKP